jgi:hypothetical protein
MNPLQKLEQEVLEKGRQWTRCRLEERLQEEARKIAPVCPQSGERLKKTRWRQLTLKTVVGEVRIQVQHGYSSKSNTWICPTRRAWSLEEYQRVSPKLEARSCYTATEVGSYERAAKMAKCWGTEISDDLVHGHIKQSGQKAAELELPAEKPVGLESEFSMMIMMDGWLVRERGSDWGASLRKRKAQRIQWHEIKSAVIFRLEQQVQTSGGRGLLLEKFVTACPPLTDPVDFGKAVQTEAMRRGLGRAKKVYVVIDGAVVLWEVAEDRFRDAIKTLDFHHASEHLWAVGHALYGEGTQEAKNWVEPLLHELRHGKEVRVIGCLEELLKQKKGKSAVRETIRKETNYFQKHRDHIHYQKRVEEGVPIGSGAVESLCAQFQKRFKVSGQFWRRPGLTHLLRICVLFRNKDEKHLWN